MFRRSLQGLHGRVSWGCQEDGLVREPYEPAFLPLLLPLLEREALRALSRRHAAVRMRDQDDFPSLIRERLDFSRDESGIIIHAGSWRIPPLSRLESDRFKIHDLDVKSIRPD